MGINLFDNPNIPQEIKEKLRARNDVDFSINYDFSKVNKYIETQRKGVINLTTKVTTLYDSQNQFINYLFINIDTTETTNAYTKIQEFENLFLLIGDYANVGFAHFNILTRDGYAQDTWYRNLGEKDGTPMTEVIGVYSHVHPEDQAVLKSFVRGVKEGKATSLRKEVRVSRENGKYTWTSINVMVRDYRPEEGIIEMLCINYDITTLKETEQKLIIARDKAEELDRLKSAFLANMSHEIRTPLNAIVGFSDLLMNSEEQGDKEEYMQIINTNNELLLKLINDILDLSKLESGSVELKYEEFDLAEYFDSMASSMKQRVTNPKVQLVAVNPYSVCRVRLDKNRVAQVVTNYVTNAIKYTPQGTIEMGYEVVDAGIRLYVRDTGIGIPEEKKRKVFHRFEKLDEFAQGTGLGLSICKAITESMGGSVGFESEYSRGSLFWAVLPCDPEVQMRRESNIAIGQNAGKDDLIRSGNQHSALDRKTVLVVEDISSNYLLISAMLSKHYNLLHAVNGEQAVAMVKEYKIDLLLMDMKMPVMDGLTATAEIRKFDTNIPIVALTAHAFESDKVAALKSGCNDYLVKPVDKARLMSVLRKYCHPSTLVL